MFFAHTTPEKFKTQESLVVLDLCLRKTRSAKSHDCRDTIDFEKLRFQNVFRPHENEMSAFSNSSCVKGVFEKLRFQNVYVFRPHENERSSFSNSSCVKGVFEKLRFQNVYVFRPHENERSAFSNSSFVKGGKLRFRDGLVWTVGLTVEIELRLLWTLEDITAVLRKLRALVESKPPY